MKSCRWQVFCTNGSNKVAVRLRQELGPVGVQWHDMPNTKCFPLDENLFINLVVLRGECENEKLPVASFSHEREQQGCGQAPTGVEPRWGSMAWYAKHKVFPLRRKFIYKFGSPKGNWTPDSALRGRRLNLLTIGPDKRSITKQVLNCKRF